MSFARNTNINITTFKSSPSTSLTEVNECNALADVNIAKHHRKGYKLV